MALRNRKSQQSKNALDHIEELRQAAQAESAQERELQRERAAAVTRHGEASEALTIALADGRDGVSERKALEEAARAASAHWTERLEAQQRRVRQAERAVNAYIAENWREVEREKRQRDDAAQAQLERAADEFDAALKGLNAEDAAWSPLLRAREIQRGPHPLGLDNLARELRRAREGGFRSPTPPEVSGEGSAAPVDADATVVRPGSAGFITS